MSLVDANKRVGVSLVDANKRLGVFLVDANKCGHVSSGYKQQEWVCL